MIAKRLRRAIGGAVSRLKRLLGKDDYVYLIDHENDVFLLEKDSLAIEKAPKQEVNAYYAFANSYKHTDAVVDNFRIYSPSRVWGNFGNPPERFFCPFSKAHVDVEDYLRKRNYRRKP